MEKSEGDNSRAKAQSYQEKNYTAGGARQLAERMQVKRESSFTEITSTIPYLVKGKTIRGGIRIDSKKVGDYLLPAKLEPVGKFLPEQENSLYLEKRINVKSHDKLSLNPKDNQRQNIEEMYIGHNLPNMERLNIRKNNRSNARNLSHTEKVFYEKSKSQRRAIPLRNPISMEVPDFKLSGVIKGKNFQSGKSSENPQICEQDRVLGYLSFNKFSMRHSRFKARPPKSNLSCKF